MLKKKFYLILFFLLIFLKASYGQVKVYIQMTVDKEIITNIDIQKEIDYLKILNPNLSSLENKKIANIAKKSLINEIIKEKEIEKFIVSDQSLEIEEDLLKNLYTKLNFTRDEFENLLIQKNNYSLNEIKKKLKIEILWNDLIFFKFNKQIKIDEKKLLERIENLESKDKKEYFLSEIIFEKDINQNLDDLVNKIKSSINEIGFDNTANIYSISNTSKYGGKIGWVDETSLSKLINKNLINKEINQTTDIIQIGNNYIILKINDIRYTPVSIDKDKELKKMVEFEKNRQLNQLSKIYFNKAKVNYSINEK